MPNFVYQNWDEREREREREENDFYIINFHSQTHYHCINTQFRTGPLLHDYDDSSGEQYGRRVGRAALKLVVDGSSDFTLEFILLSIIFIPNQINLFSFLDQIFFSGPYCIGLFKHFWQNKLLWRQYSILSRVLRYHGEANTQQLEFGYNTENEVSSHLILFEYPAPYGTLNSALRIRKTGKKIMDFFIAFELILFIGISYLSSNILVEA